MIEQHTVNEFLDLACLTYSDSESPRRIKRASQLLRTHEGLASATLHTAAAAGNTNAVSSFLKENPGLVNDVGGPRMWAPLMYLCYSRVPESGSGGDFVATAKTLLDHGADPNAFFLWGDTYRFTALTGAIGEGERGVKSQPPHECAMILATMLLDAGADPNEAQGLYNSMFRESNQWLELLLNRGLTPSHRINWKTKNLTHTVDFFLGHAAQHGFLERVTLLLKHGANPRSLNDYNNRTHHTNATLNGYGEIAELLEQHGAEAEELSAEEAFRAACMRSDREMARELMEQDPGLIENPSLLSDAVANGLVTAVELLMDLGADIDALTTAGNTALHQAAWSGHLDIARTLVAHGAQLLRDTAHDATPAGWAGYGGQPELLEFLLEYSDDIFDLAAYGSVDVLAHALEMEPEIAALRDKHGNTPIHYVSDEHPDASAVLRILAAHGVDLDAKNKSGQTALGMAVAAGAEEIVSTLKHLGATS